MRIIISALFLTHEVEEEEQEEEEDHNKFPNP